MLLPVFVELGYNFIVDYNAQVEDPSIERARLAIERIGNVSYQNSRVKYSGREPPSADLSSSLKSRRLLITFL